NSAAALESARYRPQVLAVVNVGRNVVPGIDLFEEREERRIVRLQIVGTLNADSAVIELEVRPEPPLRSFGPILRDRVDRVLVRVETLRFGGLVRGFDLGEQL